MGGPDRKNLVFLVALAVWAAGCSDSGDMLSPGEECTLSMQFDLDSSGGFMGTGGRDYGIEGGAMTVADPGPLGGQCTRDLTPAELDQLYEAASAVDWKNLPDALVHPDNPDCCCDQLIYHLGGTIVLCDGARGADTRWCEESVGLGLLPQPLLHFVSVIRSIGADVAAGC